MTEFSVLCLRRLLALAAIAAMTGGAFAPADSDWPMPAKDYASTRYSTLADLSPAARQDLDRAATWLETNEAARVLVEGYSDQRGEAQPNQALAERRADSIRNYLVAKGIESGRITTVAYGGRQVCQEPLEMCWKQSRRAVVRMMR